MTKKPSRDLQAQVLNTISELVVYYDRTLRIEWANRAAADSVGLSVEDLIGRHCHEIWHRRAAPCDGCPVIQARETGQSHTAEMVTPDGRVWHVRGYPILDENGRVEALVELCQDISDRKRSERALQEREQRLASIFRAAPIGIGIVVNRVITDANDRLCQMVGYRREELIGQSARLLYPTATDYEYVGREKYRQIEEQGTGSVETHWQRKDGEIIEVLLSSTPLDPTDLTRGVTFTALDITARKRTERALRESEAKYRMLIENQSDLLVKADGEGRILFASPSYCRLFGKREEELLGQTFMPFVHPDDRRATEEALATLHRPPHTCYVEQRALTVDGWRWLAWSDTAILNERGQIEVVIGSGRDITERKEAERALHESQARLELAVQGADLGMYDWNVQTGEIVINDRYAAMLGYTVEELDLTMEKWAATIHPDDRSREVEMVAQQLAGDDSLIETVYRVQTRAGDWRWVLDRGKVVERDADGRPIRVAGTRLDITARKQAEEERAALQTQLLQAQKMEAVGRLTAGIAHDFNNLLTVIMGFSELIKLQLAPGDRLHDPLDKVMNAGNTAANLVQQLMAFSRQQVMQLQVLDLNQVIGRVEPMVRRIIGEDVALEVRLGDNLWPVTVDPTQIQQVIVNLIVNAREAMPHGGRISLETYNITLDARQAAALADARPGDYVAMRISDTGCGMSAEVQARIFDPFFTTKPQGTGLGLPTVYGIVTQSGGWIQVDSTVGQGSAFTVFLPRTNRVADVAATPSEPPVRRGSETILLVEDSLEVRLYAREVLRDYGYTVLEASCGQEALRLADEVADSVDLLLTDVVMPDMSGRAVAEQLRQRQSELRILFMSGYTDDVLQTHGALGNGVAFLQKPFTARDLLTAVQRSLDDSTPAGG